MKKNSALLFLFTLFIFSKSITAQVTELELTTGFYKSDFSSLTIKSLDDKNKFSVSTLAFFQKFYRKEDFLFDETGVQTSVYWNFTKNLSAGPSLYYNSVSGFSEKLSFPIFIGGSHLVFVAIPASAERCVRADFRVPQAAGRRGERTRDGRRDGSERAV